VTARTELVRDVWAPFAAAFAAGDTTGYLDLYRADLIRASGGGVQGFEAFARDIAGSFAAAAAAGERYTIEFRFTERLADGDLASERGVFRITRRRAGDEVGPLYGTFHTYLRREGGRWRIAADTDAPDGTEAAFAAAAPG
jgi:ketosteroid isomerase-like protein